MNNQIDLNLLKTFLYVIELSSFTRASKILRWPKSRVSKSIKRLEKELGVSLLKRTTRSLAPTSYGQELYLKIRPLIKGIDEELIAIKRTHDDLEGVIKITAAEDFGDAFLNDLIFEFNKLYPLIKFQILFSNEYEDLATSNIDLAFRIGKLEDSSLIQKKIGTVDLIFVATPEYIKLNTHKDLENHRVYSFIKMDLGKVFDPLDEITSIKKIKYHYACSSFPLIVSEVLQNRGVGLIPSTYLQKKIYKNSFVRVFPQYSLGKRSIHLIYAPTTAHSRRLKVFINFVTAKISKIM